MEASKSRVKAGILLLAGILVTGCYSASAPMTQEKFSTVYVGTAVSEVIKENGQPYSVQNKNGMKEYVYIERINNGNQLIYENHFIFYVEDGVVVGKTVRQEKRPPYNIMYQDDPNYPEYP